MEKNNIIKKKLIYIFNPLNQLTINKNSHKNNFYKKENEKKYNRNYGIDLLIQ